MVAPVCNGNGHLLIVHGKQDDENAEVISWSIHSYQIMWIYCTFAILNQLAQIEITDRNTVYSQVTRGG